MNHSVEKLPASLAVVAPFYNEEDGAEKFYLALLAALKAIDAELYMVFVDDGSSDGTLSTLNKIADRDPRVTVLSLARNFGHQIALTAGIDHAEADAVVTMDSDLQHPPDIIPAMWAVYQQGFEVVYGVRQNDDTRGFLKRYMAQTYYKFLNQVADINVIEGAVDFRLMSRRVVNELQQMREKHRYLRGMVPWLGFPYSIVHYKQQARHAGTSKYSWTRLIRLAEAGFFSFSTFPLDVIARVGWITVFLSSIYFLYILVFVVILQMVSAPEGWVSIVVALLLTSGMQLISMGIIAKYIGMIFEEVKQRPLYTLKLKRVSHPNTTKPSVVETYDQMN